MLVCAYVRNLGKLDVAALRGSGEELETAGVGGGEVQKLDEVNFSSNCKFFPANSLKSIKIAKEKFGKT